MYVSYFKLSTLYPTCFYKSLRNRIPIFSVKKKRKSYLKRTNAVVIADTSKWMPKAAKLSIPILVELVI